MTLFGRCLGDKVADLADGRLRPARAERAYAHVAVCASCAAALAAQREASGRLAAAGGPQDPPTGLLDRLRGIDPAASAAPTWAAPEAASIPAQPRAGDRPSGAAGLRPGSPRPSGRPSPARRRHRGRIALASVAGAAAIAIASVAGGSGAAVSGPTPHPAISIAPVVDRLTDAHATTTDQLPFSGPRIVTVAYTGDASADPASPAP